MWENKVLNLCKSEKKSCCLYYKAVCITRNFSEPQNLQFIIKSGFKSRVGYNGACTVSEMQYGPSTSE